MDDQQNPALPGRASGTMGEVHAEQYLKGKGWRILDHNVSTPGAEIDLVAMDGEVVVFLEVKVRNHSRVAGRETVTPAKQRRIFRAALLYLKAHRLLNRQARFDVIEIQDGHLTHLRNAFPYAGSVF